MKKKGVLFIVDVIIGFAILFIGVIVLFSYYYSVPISNQPEFLKDDITSFVLTTKFVDFTSRWSAELLGNGTVTEDQLVSSYVAYLCAEKDSSKFTEFINETVRPLIPEYVSYKISVFDDGDVCLLETKGPALAENQIVSTSQNIIMGVDGNQSVIGPYVFEVRLW